MPGPGTYRLPSDFGYLLKREHMQPISRNTASSSLDMQQTRPAVGAPYQAEMDKAAFMKRRKSLQLRSNGTKSSQGHHRMRNRMFGQTPDKFVMGARGSTRGESIDANANIYY